MKKLLDFEKVESVINYYDTQNELTIKDGNEEKSLDELCERLGIDEDNYPLTLKDFNKLKLGLNLKEYTVIGSDEPDNLVFYTYIPDEKEITVCTDNFTAKEFYITLTMLDKLIENSKLLCRICIGTSNDYEHFTSYCQECTVFGMWWNDFFKLCQDNAENLELIDIHADSKEGVLYVSFELKENNADKTKIDG